MAIQQKQKQNPLLLCALSSRFSVYLRQHDIYQLKKKTPPNTTSQQANTMHLSVSSGQFLELFLPLHLLAAFCFVHVDLLDLQSQHCLQHLEPSKDDIDNDNNKGQLPFNHPTRGNSIMKGS